MPQTVETALAEATLYSDKQDYALVKLPPAAITAAAGVVAEIGEPFCALLADKDEVSLLIPAQALADFANRLPGHTAEANAYRLITLDVVLEPDLTGFFARVSQALADAGVSILALSAFSRDHLFVPKVQFDAAFAALQSLKNNR